MDNSFRLSELLYKNPVKSILTPKPILIVNSKECVDSLLMKLNQNDLRCAIVHDTNNLFIGFVDALDICAHILNTTGWRRDVITDSFRDLLWEGERFSSEISGKLINISDINPFRTIHPDMALIDVVELLAQGIYRLPVVENGIITNIVSQSDILIMICSRISLVGQKFGQRVDDAKIGTPFAFTVSEDLDVISAIKSMFNAQVSGAPLVDKKGRIISSFSATDLLVLNYLNSRILTSFVKNLTFTTFPLLTLSTKEFLFRNYGYIKPPICCKGSDTIENVILKMLGFKIHRVFCVDDDFKPTGIITLTDVMNFLLSRKQNEPTVPISKTSENQ